MDKYSRFGVAFRKTFLAEHGATPVMYVPESGRPSIYHSYKSPRTDRLPTRGVASQAVSFDRFWKDFERVRKAMGSLPASERVLAHDLEKVIDFLDISVLSHLKFFDHRLVDEHKNNFYMEREWRTSKDVEFALPDIQRIIIPTRFARRFRAAFKDYDGEVFFAD